MVGYREILRLKSLNYNNTDIAISVHSFRNTIQEVVNITGALKISWPLDDEISNADLEEMLYPDRKSKNESCLIPDYPKIHRELAQKGVTLGEYERYKAGRITREQLMERKKALDVRREELTAVLTEVEWKYRDVYEKIFADVAE